MVAMVAMAAMETCERIEELRIENWGFLVMVKGKNPITL